MNEGVQSFIAAGHLKKPQSSFHSLFLSLFLLVSSRFDNQGTGATRDSIIIVAKASSIHIRII